MRDLSRFKLFSLGLSLMLLGCAPSPLVSAGSDIAPQPLRDRPTQPVAAQTDPAGMPQSLPLSAFFAASGQTVRLEVAQTPLQQEIGLMFRRSLAADRGMLFPFDPPRPVQFWMRNTLIPLDMVFLLNGRIRAIEAYVPPCTTPVCPTYGTAADVNQVIELPGGRAAALGLAVGQQIGIQPIAN